MSNIVSFTGMTKLDISAENMLRNIADDNPDKVFVIAWTADGYLPTYHSNTGDMPVILYRLNEFIHNVYSGEYK